MHEHSSRRRRPARAGTLALALGVCLCAGQLVAGPAMAAPAVTHAATTSAVQQAASPVPPRLTLLNSHGTIGWGGTVTLTTRVNDPGTGAAVTGGNVQFQVLTSGRWRTWATRAVKNGVAGYRTPLHGTVVFRAVYLGKAGEYRAASTGRVGVRVVASGAKVLYEARKHVGKPYRYAASGPRAFDCSGFTQYVYRVAAGRKLPHKAHTQQRYGRAVSKASARPGDLIVIRSGGYGYHVGVYAGGGYMYDSPRPGRTVGKHKIFSRNYVVRRLAG